MSDLNSKLFVNLGASQVRRRLKGFGHGVCKVETAGNNKAVINVTVHWTPMMTTLAASENSHGPLCLILCGSELPCENRLGERCDRIEIIDFHFLLGRRDGLPEEIL